MRTSLLLRAAAVALALAAIPFQAVHASEATLETFDSCWKKVRSLPRAREVDVAWDELRREYRPRADAAEPGLELREVLNEMLGAIGISHCAVLDRATYRGMMRELSGLPTPTFGLLLEEMAPRRLFVRAMYEAGPAERAGLRLGDEIVAVDDEPPLASEAVVDAGYDPRPRSTRLFTLRARAAGAELGLRVRSAAGERPRTATLAAEETSGLESGRRSVRVVRRDGLRIGIVHLWMVARGSGDLVHEALRGELAGCDAVVVDLRGRGGFADEIDGILAPFRAARRARGDRRPAVFLIDDRSRSAKEILAWNIRHERLGPLVGEKTEGAVLGAHFVPLPGGLWLELGAMEVPVADGTSLEGVGVEPTHPVRHLAPFARGVDPILERGLELAAAAATGRDHARPTTRRGPY